MMREPFTFSRAMLRVRDGREIVLPESESGQDSIVFSNETGKAGAELIREGEKIAIKVAGELAGAEPFFGYQPAFHEAGGIVLELALSSGLQKEMEFVSIYQHKEWWTRPVFGRRCEQIPPKSQLVILKSREEYHVFLVVCGEETRADLEGCPGGLKLTLSSNLGNQRELSDLALVYAKGKDPYALAQEAAGLALKLTGKALRLRREKKLPEIFEKIGWCSWDSLGQDVNERAVFEKMEELNEKKLPVSWVLIDDGWSPVDKEKQTLTGLDADLQKFPKGLAGTVKTLKEKYQVEYVGVWQAIKGYWAGVEENSEAGRLLGNYLTRYPNGEITMEPKAESAFGFWNLWHSRLKRAGIDFVKVDSQSSFSIAARGSCTYGKLAQVVHTGLEASADLNFAGNLINCMGMAPEDIWNRQSASLSRSSDDFAPRVPGSFAEHALQNAYNSVYQGCFYWCDWDMVWSCHEDVKQNMMIRVLSGGPIYLSDGVGNTDAAQIWPVILEDGRILRCQDVGRPTLDCLTRGGEEGDGLLKIYNRYGDVVYVGAIPVKETEEPLRGSVQVSDFPVESFRKKDFQGNTSLWDTEEFWVYDWKKKEAVLCGRDSSFAFSLKPRDAELFHLIPKRPGIALVGITDKYISAACAECIPAGEGEYLIRSLCAGELCFLTTEKVKEVRQDGCPAAFERKGDLYSLSCAGMGHVISVRVE